MIMNKKEKAIALFKDGYNCSQAVLLAFAEELGLDEKTALKLATPFGGGMGRLREVCGAFSGLLMVAGLKYAPADPKDQKAKAAHYALVQQLAEAFKKQNGSIICRELLGVNGAQAPVPQERTEQYYKKRPCADMVGSAAEILEKLLSDNQK
ncbi:MAG: C_GCAxxG_C_C family protein [Elusimicrobiaceae bacterium]|nr:C_GCAxxG_C_C family protein [Elusimicrobiaceae bacterium]